MAHRLQITGAMRSPWSGPRVRSRAIVACAFVACLAISCAPCEGRIVAQQLAGVDAIDCGHVSLFASSRDADRCAVNAMRAGRGFFLEQDLRGIDSAVSEFFVRESQSGAMHRLVYDDGSPHLGVRLTEQACIDVRVVTRDGFEQITCTPSGRIREVCTR